MDRSLLLGWAFGGLVVLLFGWRKFHEQHPDMKPLDRDRVLAEVYYHNLAIHRTFSKALAIYLSTLIFVYATLVIVGKPLIGVNTEKIVGAAWPAFCGLLVAGLAPNVPWLSTLGLWVRGMLHNRAMVLRYVDEIREELTISQPRLDGLAEIDRKRLSLPSGVLRTADLDKLDPTTATWVNVALLFNAFEQNSRTARIRNRIANAFYQRFKLIWQRIRQEFHNLQPQIPAKQDETEDQHLARLQELSPLVTRLADDVYSFVGCAVANRSSQMSMRQAFTNLRLDFSSTQQAEYQVERESQQQADMLVFAYFAALASIGGLYIAFSLANDMFGLSARMGWEGFPKLYAIGRNLFAVFCEYISVGLGMFIVFSYRRNRIEDNEWFQTSEVDNDPKKVAAGSYVSAGAILAAFFVSSFLLLDIVVPLGSGNACSVGWTPACSNLVFEKITTFPERNWMRVVYGVAACLLIVGFLDRVGRSEGRARQSRRLAVVVTVAAALEFLGKLNLEIVSLRQPLDGPTSILSSVDKGYLVLVGCSAIVFWGVFGARAYHRLKWSAVRDLDAKPNSHRIEETLGLEKA